MGFYTLTNAIGGVDVCLKNPVDDELSGARFPAGPRTVAGHDALAFVRQRHGLPNGDLDRIRRQQAFLASMSRKILSSGTLADPLTLARLLDAVRGSVVLDGDWDLLRFGQQMQDVSGGAVAFLTIPTQGTQNIDGRGDVVRRRPHRRPAVRRRRHRPRELRRPRTTGPRPAPSPWTCATPRARRAPRPASSRCSRPRATRARSPATPRRRPRAPRCCSAPPATRRAPAWRAASATCRRASTRRCRRTRCASCSATTTTVPARRRRRPRAWLGSGGESSNGLSGSAETPAPVPPPQPAITAEGVACVD